MGVKRRLFWWRFLCHPLVIYAVAQDPGFLRSTEGSVGGYLIRRVVQYASVNLVRESFLLRLVFDGRLTPSGPLPLYLTPTGFDQVRKNLDRMDIHCSDLRDFIGRSRLNGSLKWSLSDVSGWMTERAFHDLLRAIAQRGAPGDRFCARNFAARREIPADLRRGSGAWMTCAPTWISTTPRWSTGSRWGSVRAGVSDDLGIVSGRILPAESLRILPSAKLDR